jgi:hypothetical protein
MSESEKTPKKDRESERPVDTIRKMNPGADIPTGAELAERIKKREKANQN